MAKRRLTDPINMVEKAPTWEHEKAFSFVIQDDGVRQLCFFCCGDIYITRMIHSISRICVMDITAYVPRILCAI